MLTQLHHQTTAAPAYATIASRLLARLLAADARHRDGERLRRMPAERLDDIGLTRRDVDRAVGSAEPLPLDPSLGW